MRAGLNLTDGSGEGFWVFIYQPLPAEKTMTGESCGESTPTRVTLRRMQSSESGEKAIDIEYLLRRIDRKSIVELISSQSQACHRAAF